MKFNFEKIREEKDKEIDKHREIRSLSAAIKKAAKAGKNPVIAEAKTHSPRRGKISVKEPEDAAVLLEEGGACAISVLTDKHFSGKICHLRRTKNAVSVPVLRKDFIVDPFQLVESRGNGADAVLLIAALLKEKTQDYVDIAHKLGLQALVEAHDEEDLRYALDSGAEMIGINNRDLKTLEVDLGASERLIKKIPKNKIIVAESGIKTKEDIVRLKNAGVTAFLIGTAIMEAKDLKKKTAEFTKP